MTAVLALLLVGILAGGLVLLMTEALKRAQRQNERERMHWERERTELLNRIMYLSDRPWSPPPVEESYSPPYEEEQLWYPERELIEPYEVTG